MDKTEILKEKLADAEVVLIGIGEEFNEKDSLYAAMDVGSIWLERALAGK